MRRSLRNKPVSILILATAFCAAAFAQTASERTAISLEQQGKIAEAEAAWKAALKANPSDPVPLAHLGLLEARQDRFTEAIRFYREAMALQPSMPGLRLNIGLAYFKDGQYAQAVQMFLPLFKTDAASPAEMQRLNVLTGMSYYGLGENAKAIPYLQAASANDAQNLPLLLTLAHSCLLSKQFQCVLDQFHQMVALNANSAEADILVGEALDEMKDSAGAISEFRAAIAANPKEPNAHFGLGYLLWTQKQYGEAAHEFQAEIDNTPDHSQALLYLADADIQLNKLDEARSLLEKLIATNRDSYMARLDLGIIYSETNRNDDALRELKAAQLLKPDDINVHWRLGRLYRSEGKVAEAKAEFDKAQNLNTAADDALLDVLSNAPSKTAQDKPKPTQK